MVASLDGDIRCAARSSELRGSVTELVLSVGGIGSQAGYPLVATAAGLRVGPGRHRPGRAGAGTGGRRDDERGQNVAQRFEYRVVELREGLMGGKMSGDKLEKVLNQHARVGWQLKAITSVEVKGRIGPGGVEGVLVTLERPTT